MRAPSCPFTSQAAECQRADCRNWACAPQVDSGGFASIGNVTQSPPQHFNKMESFWLSGALLAASVVCTVARDAACMELRARGLMFNLSMAPAHL